MKSAHSKEALDKIINKSRVHLYKPIQIAEILYHNRNSPGMNLADVESYRNISKRWRDDVTKRLVGRVSTSSQKFQDNLFEANAVPPSLLTELGEINNKNKGIVENYIYHRLKERLFMVSEALNYIKVSGTSKFDLHDFLEKFTSEPGLRRSVDKAYEITVFALFSTLVRALDVEVRMSIKNPDKEICADFSEFIELVLGLHKGVNFVSVQAKLFRVGATNAADRGLDMWANFGPAVQVKHISLSEEIAEDVSHNISADRIILVCMDAEAEMIKKITQQLPFSDRIQGIITLGDLKRWYKLCLSQKYKSTLGKSLMQDLEREFNSEFPVSIGMEPFLKERGYIAKNLIGDWSL